MAQHPLTQAALQASCRALCSLPALALCRLLCTLPALTHLCVSCSCWPGPSAVSMAAPCFKGGAGMGYRARLAAYVNSAWHGLQLIQVQLRGGAQLQSSMQSH